MKTKQKTKEIKKQDRERFDALYKKRIWGSYMTEEEINEYNKLIDKVIG